MIIDTHSHINFQAFNKDRGQVIKRAQKNKVAMIVVGSNFKTSRKAVEIAKKHEEIFASIGLHPVHLIEQVFEEGGKKVLCKAEKFDFSAFEELALNSDVKAIGETGLDYYHVNPKIPIEEQKNLQKQVLIDHINLADKTNLPLILHCRGSKENPKDAYEDLLKIIKKSSKKMRGVMHCFSSNWQLAEKFLDLGLYLGFTGVITYTDSLDLIEVVQRTPENRILSETDCPYLTPVPYRGKRNEPSYVEFVIEKIADIRQVDYEQAAKFTFRNGKRLFDLDV